MCDDPIQAEDWDVLVDYVVRAHNSVDMRAGRTHKNIVDSKNMPGLTRFRLAHTGYYRQAAIMQADDGQAQLNYALCLQFVYSDYEGATHYYLRGLQADPYNTKIMENFNLMLFNLKVRSGPTTLKSVNRLNALIYIQGSDDDGFELMLRHQAKTAADEDARRQDKQRHECAIKIQSQFRARKTRSAVCCRNCFEIVL